VHQLPAPLEVIAEVCFVVVFEPRMRTAISDIICIRVCVCENAEPAGPLAASAAAAARVAGGVGLAGRAASVRPVRVALVLVLFVLLFLRVVAAALVLVLGRLVRVDVSRVLVLVHERLVVGVEAGRLRLGPAERGQRGLAGFVALAEIVVRVDSV